LLLLRVKVFPGATVRHGSLHHGSRHEAKRSGLLGAHYFDGQRIADEGGDHSKSSAQCN
jgi:hypothetical protein